MFVRWKAMISTSEKLEAALLKRTKNRGSDREIMKVSFSWTRNVEKTVSPRKEAPIETKKTSGLLRKLISIVRFNRYLPSGPCDKSRLEAKPCQTIMFRTHCSFSRGSRCLEVCSNSAKFLFEQWIQHGESKAKVRTLIGKYRVTGSSTRNM